MSVEAFEFDISLELKKYKINKLKMELENDFD